LPGDQAEHYVLSGAEFATLVDLKGSAGPTFDLVAPIQVVPGVMQRPGTAFAVRSFGVFVSANSEMLHKQSCMQTLDIEN